MNTKKDIITSIREAGRIVLIAGMLVILSLALSVLAVRFDGEAPGASHFISHAGEIEPTVQDDTTVRVYLTISYDSEFVRAGNDADISKRTGKVLARVPMDISYVDLKKYGLQEYYRYDSINQQEGFYDSTAIAVQPTVLMLYLRATSLYYLGREITADDIGDKSKGTQSNTLTVSGGAQHLYFESFWGHSENLMYYVNHEYPIWYSDQGATADYILLSDGDEIDVGLFSDMSFNQFGAFSYFDTTSPRLEPGEVHENRLLSTVTHEGSVPGEPLPGETIRVSSDYGETWEKTEIKTGEDGEFSISFDEPGIYYVSAGPRFVRNIERNTACIAPPIAVVEVDPAPVTDGKLIKAGGSEGVSGTKCTWDDQGSRVSYKVDYRKTGDKSWTTDTVTEPGYTVPGISPEECEVRVTPFILNDYQPYGIAAKKVSGGAVVIRYDGASDDGGDDPKEETEEERKAREERERREKEEEERKANERKTAAFVASAKACNVKVSAKAIKAKGKAKKSKKRSAKVSWKKPLIKYSANGASYTAGVTGYKVYRAAKKSGKYKLVKTIGKAGTTKWTDKKLKKGKKYFYKVRPFTKISGKTYLGKWSNAAAVKTK